MSLSRGGKSDVEDVRKRDLTACIIAAGVTVDAIKGGELLVDKHPDRARRVKDQSQTHRGAGKGSKKSWHPKGAAVLTVQYYCEHSHKNSDSSQQVSNALAIT